MASCPICSKKHIFGEQVGNSGTDCELTYYDCPRCGAFRINLRAKEMTIRMEDKQSQALFFWIRERNSSGVIPSIDENFVTDLNSTSLRAAG